MKQPDFLGQGWAFPVRPDAVGGIALVPRERGIEDSIHLILGTAIGERPMRPEFGCGIHDYVFAPTDATTAGRIAHEVRVALRRWEPRIEVDDVRVEPADDEPAVLRIEIDYRLAATNSSRNLVFPFYLIPPEE